MYLIGCCACDMHVCHGEGLCARAKEVTAAVLFVQVGDVAWIGLSIVGVEYGYHQQRRER